MTVTTSKYNISTEKDDFTTDNYQQLQELVDNNIHVIIDTVVNISSTIVTAFEGQTIECAGAGEIRPISDNMAVNPMFILKHKNCRMHRLKATNPKLLYSANGRRQGVVDIRADYCTISECEMVNHLNAVTADSKYSAHGTSVINNRFIDCLGVGKEDRGDAVTLWGSGNLISGNYASCKEGHDARIAFHIEAPVSRIYTPRKLLDKRFSIMQSNRAIGGFRRHFAFENVNWGIMTDNVSMGGATWWCECFIQCSNCYSRNSLMFDYNKGSRGSIVKRAAIGFSNYNRHCISESMACLTEGATGYGLAISQEQGGKHDIEFRGSLLDESGMDNTAVYLIKPSRFIFRGSARGFKTGIKAVQDNSTNIMLIGAEIEAKSGSAVYFQEGSGSKFTCLNSVLSSEYKHAIDVKAANKFTTRSSIITGGTDLYKVNGSYIKNSINNKSIQRA